MKHRVKDGTIDICSATRLTSHDLKEMETKHPGTITVYRQARMRFLSEWFALIELGILEPFWSTFPQRLDYLIEFYGEEVKSLGIKSGVSYATLSKYRNRRKCDLQVSAGGKNVTIAKHVIGVIRGSKCPANFAWIMQGSHDEYKTSIRSRCIFALKALYGKYWKKSVEGKVHAISAIGEGESTEDRISDKDHRKMALDIERLSYHAVDHEWLLTGKIRPPRQVEESMKTIADEGPFQKWNARHSESDKRRLESLVELFSLVERHSSSLSADAYKFAFGEILSQLGKFMVLSPLVHMNDGGWSEDDIRERRKVIYMLSRKGKYPKVKFDSLDGEFHS